MSSKPVCAIDGCDRPSRSRGQCNTHYHAWRRKNLNTASGPNDDPRMGFCARLTDFLAGAPDGMLSTADRTLITSVAFTAAAQARGVLPITAAMRREMLRKAVDSITDEVHT